MNHRIKVSVIIPVFNSATFLSQCLDSVLSQTLKEIEIICVNNGSNDNSLRILKQFAKLEPRITIINTPKSNAGYARNIGIQASRGEYLAFLDADDFYEPLALETAYNAATKHGSDIVVFEFYTFDHQTQSRIPSTSGILPQIPEATFAPSKIQPILFGVFKNCPWNKLFRRSFITDHQITFQEIPRGNDIFFTYMSLALSHKITTIRTPLVNYRINNKHSLQSTNQITPLSFWDAFKYLKIQLSIKGLYQKYEQSFLTELLNNAIYNLNKLPQKSKAYIYLLNTIRYGTEIEFHISDHPANYYNPDSYKEYQEIINLPTTEELIDQAVSSAVTEITSSKSHKIGLAITKIPRKIIKTIKNN